jgi:DNA polymerase
LAERAAGCRDCPLWRGATQTVFGEGPPRASLLLVGEQPGDREDREGHPFVGPAGGVLDRALEMAGVEREQAYVTNAVKHFKYRMRGKRRIHQRPDASEIAACRKWLEAEIELLRPRAIVCLGATAGRSVLGRAVAIGRERGELLRLEQSSAPVLITAHPSSVLRERDADARHAATARLADDLGVAARAAELL